MASGGEQMARRFAEAITRCDRDSAIAVCHPEIEFSSVLGISGRAYLGHDGVRQYLDDVESAWDEWTVEVEQIVEAEDGRVVIVMTMHARGRGSGASLATHRSHLDAQGRKTAPQSVVPGAGPGSPRTRAACRLTQRLRAAFVTTVVVPPVTLKDALLSDWLEVLPA